jgi:DNA-binding transcriptional LysR family regulator
MTAHFTALDETLTHVGQKDERVEGRIRLTAPEDLGNQLIAPIVTEFSRQYPDVSFEMIFTNELLNLVKLGVDVAVRVGNLKDSGLLVRKAGRLDFVMVAAPLYLETAGAVASPDDLSRHKTIAFAPFIGKKFTWKIKSAEGGRDIPLRPAFVANNFLTIRELARLGRGIAFVPRFLVQDLVDSKDLAIVLRGWGEEGLPVQIVLPGQRNLARRLKVFADFCAKRMAAVL